MYEDPRDMFREMDEMFSRLVAGMNAGFGDGEPQGFSYQIIVLGGDGRRLMPEAQAPLSRTAVAPAAEVHRLGDEVKVVVELPGADAESIRLEVKDHELVIEADGYDTGYHTTADLPPVDAASLQHTFRNGVLEATFRAAVLSDPEEPGAGRS